MKYIIVLLLLCLPQIAQSESIWVQPTKQRFRFRQCVQVKSGFYKGCKGNVEDFDTLYTVELNCHERHKFVEFYEDELEDCK